MRLNRNIQKANKKGLVVVEATPKTLQLDFDSIHNLRLFGWQWHTLKKARLAQGWRAVIKNSKSRGHVHVYIHLPRPLPLGTRIALQAILGSDLKRELFNWIRGCTRAKFPVVLFERRKKRNTVTPFRRKNASRTPSNNSR